MTLSPTAAAARDKAVKRLNDLGYQGRVVNGEAIPADAKDDKRVQIYIAGYIACAMDAYHDRLAAECDDCGGDTRETYACDCG